MAKFIDRHAKKAEQAWYSRDAPPSNCSKCPSCQHPLTASTELESTLFRCLDCPLSRPQCSRCILENHQTRPFDRIRKWCLKRRLWGKATLPELGFVLHLGHDGVPCPSTPKKFDGTLDIRDRTRDMVIMHEHGQTEVPVLFCQCTNPRTTEAAQLLEEGLWPATWLKPRTAITDRS